MVFIDGLVFIGGILLIIVIWKIAALLGRHKNESSIEPHAYKKMILPSNKGRSIDTVVDNLKKSDITPEFTLNSKDK